MKRPSVVMSEEETSALRRLLPPGNDHLLKALTLCWQTKDRRDHVLARINFRQLAFYFVFFPTQTSLWRGGVARQNTQQIKNVTTVKLALKRPCEDLVAAYGRWSLARKEPMGASSEKNPPRSNHSIFMFLTESPLARSLKPKN